MSDVFLHAVREADQQQIRDLDARIRELEAEVKRLRVDRENHLRTMDEQEDAIERLREFIAGEGRNCPSNTTIDEVLRRA